VLNNDSDADNDLLTVRIVAQPSNGSLTLNTDGSFSYTPRANFHGTDSFSYIANDGSTDSNTATVTIIVHSVNDAPVAEGETYSTDESSSLQVVAPGVLSNDTDLEGTSLTAVLVSGPANGTLSLQANGSFVYTPHANFYGTDSFTYKATDGALASNTVTVTITVNSLPLDTLIENLEAEVSELVTIGAVLPADGNSLHAKLSAAQAALEAGDTATARTKLMDFINQVRAFVKAGKLSAAQGRELTDAANAILTQL
jgi:large repetitive protein